MWAELDRAEHQVSIKMEGVNVFLSNLWALQERRYAVVYVAVTKFVRTMLRLILLSTPRYFW